MDREMVILFVVAGALYVRAMYAFTVLRSNAAWVTATTFLAILILPESVPDWVIGACAAVMLVSEVVYQGWGGSGEPPMKFLSPLIRLLPPRLAGPFAPPRTENPDSSDTTGD